MIYGSVCSGIEAATVAWHPLGWTPAFFSEIDKFPRQVLAHHYPDVPLHGDFTTIQRGMYADIDVLVGGTPCQSFSVAGLRAGLDDPRGNLMLEFGALAQRLQPKWLVWENVPGVLSSNGGRDFGAFLGMLAELGYGFAYRVLDAQFFGVAQRRRRVFVVGCAGNWRRAAAVLFERASLRGDSAPSREKGKAVAAALRTRSPASGGQGTDWTQVAMMRDVAPCLDAMMDKKFGSNQWVDSGQFVMCCSDGQANASIEIDLCPTLTRTVEQPYISHSLRGEGFDASEDGTGRGTPLVPVSFPWQRGGTMRMPHDLNLCGTLVKNQSQAVAFDTASVLRVITDENSVAVSAEHYTHDYCQDRVYSTDGISSALNTAQRHNIRTAMQVRRLTPRECERLQGFPDDYTDIKPGGKPTPDGPRYKALGNSMAVPVMRWIGERISAVEDICKCFGLTEEELACLEDAPGPWGWDR